MYPCHENLYEAKLKSNGLITLVEEISRQHNGESVEGLLLVTFMQIYNGKKSNKLGKRNEKMCSLEKKKEHKEA